MTGVSKNTISKLLLDLGAACTAYQSKTLVNLPSKRVQCDEIWSFVGAKDKNLSAEKKEQGLGSIWTWTALDADTKLIASWLVGSRDAGSAYEFMQDVAARLRGRVQLTTDGHKPYLKRRRGRLRRGHRLRGARQDLRRGGGLRDALQPRRLHRHQDGDGHRQPGPEAHLDQLRGAQNLTMRMSMRRFTRLTNAFSKKVENHAAAIALYFMYYNFGRIHQTLRVTPAMEAGVANHVWSVDEIVALLD